MYIETIELQTADINAVQLFYQERLGLPVTVNASVPSLAVTIGTSLLIFRQEQGFTGRYHFAINIPENRLLSAKSFLEKQGIPLLTDTSGEAVFDFDFWNAHALYFYDPAGNIGEFIARHELPNALPNAENLPFAPTEIQCLSEIGLPTDSVPALARTLTDTSGIAPYRDNSPAFMPLGDANGLFILVQTGRLWFPNTGIPAEPLPIRATIHNASGRRFTLAGIPYQISPSP